MNSNISNALFNAKVFLCTKLVQESNYYNSPIPSVSNNVNWGFSGNQLYESSDIIRDLADLCKVFKKHFSILHFFHHCQLHAVNGLLWTIHHHWLEFISMLTNSAVTQVIFISISTFPWDIYIVVIKISHTACVLRIKI